MGRRPDYLAASLIVKRDASLPPGQLRPFSQVASHAPAGERHRARRARVLYDADTQSLGPTERRGPRIEFFARRDLRLRSPG